MIEFVRRMKFEHAGTFEVSSTRETADTEGHVWLVLPEDDLSVSLSAEEALTLSRQLAIAADDARGP